MGFECFGGFGVVNHLFRDCVILEETAILVFFYILDWFGCFGVRYE